MRSKNLGYYPEFDHIRAFAALLIIFYHGIQLLPPAMLGPGADRTLLAYSNPLLGLIYEGHTAVALFMVLSGFIFTFGLQGQQISYGKFILNRLLRIYPLFLLVLFTGLAASPQNFNFSGFLQTITGFANAPGRLNLGSFTAMFWAVSVEWQFYLVFPFIYTFTLKGGLRYLLGLLALFIIIRSLMLLEGGSMKDITYWTIMGRMDQFLIGMILGINYARFKKPSLSLNIAFPVILAAIFGSMFFFSTQGGLRAEHAWKLLWPTFEATLWALFILSYGSVSKYLSAYFSKRLAQLGMISFSLYLWHYTLVKIVIHYQLFIIMPGLTPSTNALLSTTFVILPLAVGLASISYHLVEKPFLNLRVTYKH